MRIFPSILLVAAVLLSLLNNNTAQAAPVSGLIVSPAIRQVRIANGSGQTVASFEIGNYSATAQELHLRIADFTAAGESSNVTQLSLDGPVAGSRYGLANWASLDQNLLVLQPQESKTVTVRINDDSSLLAGGHYGALVATTGGSQVLTGGEKVVLQQSVSGLLFLTKTGGEAYGLRLSELRSSDSLTGDMATVSLRFQNTGNVHVVPRGIVQVFDPLGKLVSQGPINVNSDLILPQTSRVEAAVMQSVSARRIPGRYRLSVQYRRDGDDAVSTSSIRFYYVQPYAIVTAVGLVLLVGALLIRLWFVRRKSAFRANRRRI